MPLEVRALAASHIEDCARLLAGRHQRDRSRHHFLPEAFTSPAATRPLIETALSEANRGVVALRNGEVIGYLMGGPIQAPVTTMSAQFTPARGLMIGYEKHAVASEADAGAYRPLYAALSEHFVRAGYHEHCIYVSASDPAVNEVWSSLGFGRQVVAAVRPVDPLVPQEATLDVRRATLEDLEAVIGLDEQLERHHALTPTYLPYRWEARPNFREVAEGFLRQPSNAYFLAYEDGKAVGLNSLLADSFMNAMQRPDASFYLFQGIIQETSRGRGLGSALLANSLRWGKEQGYRYCALHFFSANYTAAEFWLGHGFEPLEYRLTRTVDSRVVWQEPPPVDPNG
jgi:ribosomal protein S18 acetylase RimI-like enzyme